MFGLLGEIVADVVVTAVKVAEVPLAMVKPVTETVREAVTEVSDGIKDALDI